MRSDQTILDEITQEITSRLPEWYGPGADLLSSEPIRKDREFTIFLHYTVKDQAGQHIPLILKMPRDNWMTSLEEIIASIHLSSFTRDEAAILQKIEQAVSASGNPDLSAIHVLAYLDDYAVTVMEELAFQSFKQTYLKNPTILQKQSKLKKGLKHIRLAGKWLRLYHETFSINKQAATEALDLIPGTCALLEQLESIDTGDLDRLKQLFTHKHDSIQNEIHNLTTLHNDFHLNNIFITQSGRVGGFDPNPGPPDSIYVDLARVLTDCETQQVQVLTVGLFYSQVFIQQIRNRFLLGYAAELNPNILDFFCAVTVLEKWVRVEQVFTNSKLSRVPGMKIPLKFLFQRYFLGLIEGYLAA